MTQEFHISVTPIGNDDYLVRTERVAPGVPLAEEQVNWPVGEWLERAGLLMNDPLTGLLRSDIFSSSSTFSDPPPDDRSPTPQAERSVSLRRFGQQLYNALFQGTIRDSWMTAQGIAQHRQEILRLRLGLKDTRLPRLPWEVLHAGDRPLATGTDVVFCRYHSSLAVMSSPFQFQQMPLIEPGQPLKILMVLAAPSDQEILALKQEAIHLQEELQASPRNGSKISPDIQLTILEQPGREQLTQALEHNHYQVLHYAGHSNLGTAGGKLYLVNNKTGLTETLSGNDLAGLLVNNGIRMAVFNSCRGVYTAAAESGAEANDGNLAEALVKRGIPAVLAMAERIPDEVALNLSRLLYRNLKQLCPIDLSLNRARQGLLSSYGSSQMYWALPILYLHPEFDGCLLPQADETEEAVALDVTTEGATWENGVAVAEGNSAQDSLLQDPLLMDDSGLLASSDFLSNEEWEEMDTDSLPDPDDLEFDDPDYQPELGTVARLVQTLSQTSPTNREEDEPLPASPTESLLPPMGEEQKPQNYLEATENPRYKPSSLENLRRNFATATDRSASSNVNSTDSSTLDENIPIQDPSDGSVYLELEQLLAESGKPTDFLAACNQAIQENPKSSQAYDRLGLTLARQGYLAEAIAAYQQAIHYNPTLADAHHHLGQALYQQGNVREAIRAYSRAVELNPHQMEIRQSLEVALRRQGVQLPPSQQLSTAPPPFSPPNKNLGDRPPEANRGEPKLDSRSTPPVASKPSAPNRPTRGKKRTMPKPVLWVGASAAGLTTLLLGVWLLHDRVNGALVNLPLVGQPIPSSINSPEDLKQSSTGVVTAVATEQLNQGNMRAAQQAIEVLLDRGALFQAATALTPALKEEENDPTIHYLMGRLAWQFVKSGNILYSVDDARRSWERATQKQPPTEMLQNALGFVYYTKGDLDRANQAWLRTLSLTGDGAIATVSDRNSKASSQEALTAYAGLALVSMKQAEAEPVARQKGALENRAIYLRRKVLTDDAINFQAEALAKNWLWSEAAIKDWEKLQSLELKNLGGEEEDRVPQ